MALGATTQHCRQPRPPTAAKAPGIECSKPQHSITRRTQPVVQQAKDADLVRGRDMSSAQHSTSPTFTIPISVCSSVQRHNSYLSPCPYVKQSSIYSAFSMPTSNLLTFATGVIPDGRNLHSCAWRQAATGTPTYSARSARAEHASKINRKLKGDKQALSGKTSV